MLSATSRAVRIGARRVAPRAAAFAVAPMPAASLGRPANIVHARAISTTGYLANALSKNPNPPLGKKNTSNELPSRIGIIGGRGYTGQVLINLLNNHPNMDLRHVSSRELVGQELKGYTKRNIIYENLSPEDVARLDKDGKVDCWVMALPNNVCQSFVDALGDSSSLIIDLSADYRFDTTGKWTYSCPELVTRSKIAQSTRISCPGCYSTGSQLAISPLVPYLGGVPTVFGVSGFSGAGTKKSPKNDETLLKDNLLPYSLTGHIHEREISHHLGAPTAFIPHVASWFRGIQLTISIPLSKEMTSRDIRQIYQNRYAGEKLVKVVGEAPYVKSIQDKHGVEIGGFAVDNTGKRVVICATIDNLNKGAATQCLQNMNLALGYDEYQGIPIE